MTDCMVTILIKSNTAIENKLMLIEVLSPCLMNTQTLKKLVTIPNKPMKKHSKPWFTKIIISLAKSESPEKSEVNLFNLVTL